LLQAIDHTRNESLRRIGRFLIGTFASTWALWALVIWAYGRPEPSVAPPGLGFGGPVFLLGVFAPGLVAVALTARDGGRDAVRTLLRRVVQWRVDVRFYACALLLMPLTKLAVAGLYRAWTGAWPQFGETHAVLLLLATILSTLGQAGEEVGWRGYLLPRVTERFGLVVASFVVGVVWAAWHLPLFFAPATDTYRQSFPLFTLQVTAYSIALAWLYWRTGGSLLLAMLMHAAFNNMKDIVPSGGVPNGRVFSFDSTLVFRLTVLVLWIAGGFFLVRMHRASRLGDARAAGG